MTFYYYGYFLHYSTTNHLERNSFRSHQQCFLKNVCWSCGHHHNLFLFWALSHYHCNSGPPSLLASWKCAAARTVRGNGKWHHLLISPCSRKVVSVPPWHRWCGTLPPFFQSMESLAAWKIKARKKVKKRNGVSNRGEYCSCHQVIPSLLHWWYGAFSPWFLEVESGIVESVGGVKKIF